MKTAAIAITLLFSTAAIAQTMSDPNADMNADAGTQMDMPTTDMDATTDTAVTDPSDMTMHSDMSAAQSSTMPSGMTMASNMPASGSIVQPGNADPEHDARGIAVISAPAMVPAGWNGVTGTAVGGPLVDPATGETVETADASYPACTATVTDNCLQTYERGRSAS